VAVDVSGDGHRSVAENLRNDLERYAVLEHHRGRGVSQRDGRPALSASDAAQLVSGSAAKTHAENEVNHDYLVRHEQWLRDRETERQRAWQQGWSDAVRADLNAGLAAEKGHVLAREALARWDRQNAEPRPGSADSGLRQLIARVREGRR
jgi:hypothetical protein